MTNVKYRFGAVNLVLVAILSGACSDSNRTSTATPTGKSANNAGLAGASSANTGEVPEGDERIVERIVDGDTLVVKDGEKVRLIGVDTPESVDPRQPVECLGKEASTFLAGLIPPGTKVTLVYDVDLTDRYDRTLAYLYRSTDGLFVNAELLTSGYAQILSIPPDIAHADEFLELQREARDAGRGLWGDVCTQAVASTTTTISKTITTHADFPGLGIESPGDTKNCGDFANYAEAKEWFDAQFPAHGDVANLDSDNDQIPCESLSGAP